MIFQSQWTAGLLDVIVNRVGHASGPIDNLRTEKPWLNVQKPSAFLLPHTNTS